MVSRSSSALLALASLLIGMILGALADRGGPLVSAQVAKSALSSGASTAPERNSPQKPGADLQQGREDQIYAMLAKQYEQFEQVNRTFEYVAKAVSPSVVHIVAQKFSRQEPHRRVRQYEETGSGVIVRSERSAGLFVLTNQHVVDGSEPEKIHIRLHDGRTINPEKVWTDAEADIAVMKLDRTDLPASRMGNSDNVAVGSWVLALGSPFGLMQSVSQGIISARGRHVEELKDIHNQDFFQTDAAINPGNSGGPLVNMKGEVIGINNSIASEGGGNEGVGFSIPINLAHWILNELVSRGRVARGALGVELNPSYRQKEAVDLGLDRPRGAWVEVVHPLTPAANGGIQSGDVILRFGGVEIQDLNHLINTVSMAPIGEAADLTVWRDRREIHLKVTVDERDRTLPRQTPRVEAPDNAQGLIRRPDRPAPGTTYAMGLELITPKPGLPQTLSLPEQTTGAIIVSVVPDSPLFKVCQPKDVITTIGGKTISSAEQAVKLLNERNDDTPLVIEFDRLVQDGQVQRYSIRIP